MTRRSPASASVAVINYNGRPFVDELLHSLAHQTRRPASILFLDNGSTDESAGYVQNNYRDVDVLSLGDNLGFARAGNLAFTKLETDYVALLNTDMKLEPGWLEALVDQAEISTDVAAVSPKLRLYQQPGKLNGVGGQMNRLGYTWDRGMFEDDRGQYDEPQEVLFASAGAALFRRRAFQQAGGFDETFFMYHEDVDLCWRFWLFGLRVITAPQAVGYHHFGGSTKQSRGLAWREWIGERNNMRSLIKNYELSNLAAALWQLLRLRQRPARKLRQLRNFGWNLSHLAGTLRLRSVNQRRRRRSDSDLEYLIVQSTDVPIRL